jgi:hypothetical protein
MRGDGIMATDDPEEIEFLFQGIGLSDDWHTTEDLSISPSVDVTMAAYLKEQERKQTLWILESPNVL